MRAASKNAAVFNNASSRASNRTVVKSIPLSVESNKVSIYDDDILRIAIVSTLTSSTPDFEPQYEFSVTGPILYLSEEKRTKHQFRALNVTLEGDCIGSYWLASLVGMDTVVINQLMFALESDGMVQNLKSGEFWNWHGSRIASNKLCKVYKNFFWWLLEIDHAHLHRLCVCRDVRGDGCNDPDTRVERCRVRVSHILLYTSVPSSGLGHATAYAFLSLVGCGNEPYHERRETYSKFSLLSFHVPDHILHHLRNFANVVGDVRVWKKLPRRFADDNGVVANGSRVLFYGLPKINDVHHIFSKGCWDHIRDLPCLLFCGDVRLLLFSGPDCVRRGYVLGNLVRLEC